MNAPYPVTKVSFQAGARTGQFDSMGREIKVGDVVLDDDGFQGRVVFANGGLRYDVKDGHYLRFHSSYLYGDGCGTKRLTVIKDSGNGTKYSEML